MWRRLRPDGFLLLLMAVLVAATLLPAQGDLARLVGPVTDGAIALLFFLHGAKLSRAAILAGIGAWRLHLMVLAATYALFPLLGVGITGALGGLLDPVVGMGILYLCVLPSTVQSSIAFTAMAGGNVAAAVCSASLSNIVGIVLTPLLASFLIGSETQSGADFFLSAVGSIALQILLPFVAGHLARPLVGGWIDRHKPLVTSVDRGVILLVVYGAFSVAVVEGLWTRMSIADLGMIAGLCSVLLGAVLALTWIAGRLAGLSRADAVVLLFCGSKKSLASGVPMAGALFPAAQVGPIILPLMLFHQLQLIVCTAIAQGMGRRGDDEEA
jgi:sodium/bile acid cotransporter 7